MTLALAVAPILVLLFTAGTLIIQRLLKTRLGTQWLTASGGALLAWGVVFWQRSLIPGRIPVLTWLPESIYASSPVLVFDSLTWSYAMALVTLCLAVVLTDVAQPERIEWAEWAGSLLLAGVGLFAVFAGNPLSMLLAWAAIDLAEMVILISQFEEQTRRSDVIVGFAIRTAGLGVLAWAIVVSAGLGEQLDFNNISPAVRGYLLLASAVRLAVLQLDRYSLADIQESRSLGTVSCLVAGVAGLMPILYVARSGGIATGAENTWLLAALVVGVFAGFAWLQAEDELQARSSWILGLAALVLASAVLGRPQPAVAWGLTMLLSGGALFLFATRRRLMLVIPGIGLLSLIAIPYSPGWSGAGLYGAGFDFRILPFITIQTLFCIGFIRHATRPEPGVEGPERWVWAVYPWGLAMLPVVHGLIFWLTEKPELRLSVVWPSLIVLILSTAWFIVPGLSPVAGFLNGQQVGALDKYMPRISFRWLNRGFFSGFKLIGRGLEVIDGLMEGEGGVIWALLILVLLLAIVLQFNPAGGI